MPCSGFEDCSRRTARGSSGGLIQGGDNGPSIDLKEPKESLLIKALRYEDVEMPPKGKLSDFIIADFETWIAMGAPDPRVTDELPAARTIDLDEGRKFWAFQPIVNPEAPGVNDHSWPLDAIDRFILAKQEAAGIKPVADADRYTWLRRVSLDLTGLPPTPTEIDAFIRDNSPLACATVVDRLLESRAFGERWARHWLDLTGYADMIGTSNSVFAEYACDIAITYRRIQQRQTVRSLCSRADRGRPDRDIVSNGKS